VKLANNETGVLQPVAQIAAICAEQGVPVYTDAAQAVGKVPVDFSALGVTALSCAAHKFCGPLGIGALVVRHDAALQPILFGGHQQAGLRPGTEMVALAIGMQTALECWHRSAAESNLRMTQLRDRLEQAIVTELPYVEVIGSGAARLPNTSNLAFVGINRQALLMALDQTGLACSSGSACASGSSEPSPVLVAMGLDRTVIEGSIRLSFGPSTTTAEVDEACRRISSVCQHLR
jgi:cysteine desulfurase